MRQFGLHRGLPPVDHADWRRFYAGAPKLSPRQCLATRLGHCRCAMTAIGFSHPDTRHRHIFYPYINNEILRKICPIEGEGFLAKVLADNVFTTMSLEDQQVAMPKVQQIVQSLLREQELKGGQFFSDQSR